LSNPTPQVFPFPLKTLIKNLAPRFRVATIGGRVYEREEFPLFEKGVRGDFYNNTSFQLSDP
jgi:hypothetical protein